MKRRALWCVLLLLAASAALAFAYLGEPLLGDDLTYWSTASALHREGWAAKNPESFYDLRWPLWGMCWLLQSLGFQGLASFWGVPISYLSLGAALTFFLARRLTSYLLFGFAAGLAFFFHPFLDPIASAPMPDLSEAVWGGAAMLAWWKMMQTSELRARWLAAAALGFCIFVLEANRVTGLFLVPVLILCSALFFRARFHWLIAAGCIALSFYAAECLFYHQLFGDWLHDLTVNATNRGAKGTELVNPWLLPFRFLDSFWQEPLMRFYSLGSIAGAIFAWRRAGVFGRVVVLWCALLFLEFSCTPQSLHPLRPLLRDAPRFLASLAVPMSLLALVAARELVAIFRARRFAPMLLGAGVCALQLTTKREFFQRGFVPPLRSYLASVPDGATIFTHHSMRETARLVSPRDAARFHWLVHNEILERAPEREADAARADEFWYNHTLVWLRASQRLNRQPEGAPPQLASYFAEPEKDWQLSEVLVKGDAPELVFNRRRIDPKQPTAWGEIFPAASWERGHAPSRLKMNWPIAPELRGQLVRLRGGVAANETDALTVRLRFLPRTKEQKSVYLRPLLTRESSPIFFALRLPPEASECEIQLRFPEGAERVATSGIQALSEASPAP